MTLAAVHPSTIPVLISNFFGGGRGAGGNDIPETDFSMFFCI